jgi:hypothetical protein
MATDTEGPPWWEPALAVIGGLTTTAVWAVVLWRLYGPQLR